MRKDMKDVLKSYRISRGRDAYRSGKNNPWSRARIKRLPAEDLPQKIPLNKSYSSYSNFHPIEKFLYLNIGRLWDDIYSEICKVTDRRSYRGYYLLKQLGYLIETKEHIDRRWWRRGFYIDEEGYLRYKISEKYRRPPEIIKYIPTTDPNFWYELEDGQWYKKTKIVENHRSVYYSLEWVDEIGGEVKIVSKPREWKDISILKFQMSKRELKQLRKEIKNSQHKATELNNKFFFLQKQLNKERGYWL